jgi:hypothetical protein
MRAVSPNATSLSTNSLWSERWISAREPAMQVCPVAAKMPETTPLTALSITASLNTILADFPPSSSVTGLMDRAASS